MREIGKRDLEVAEILGGWRLHIYLYNAEVLTPIN